MLASDWIELGMGDAQMRQQYQGEPAWKESHDSVTKLYEGLLMLRALLYFEGMVAADAYHDLRKEAAFTKDETKIYPRIRWDERHFSPSFFWEKKQRKFLPVSLKRQGRSKLGKGHGYVAYVPVKNSKTKEKKEVVVMTQHVPLLVKTGRIADSAFDDSPQWARIAGLKVENRLALLRKQNRILADIGRLIKRYEVLQDEFHSQEAL